MSRSAAILGVLTAAVTAPPAHARCRASATLAGEYDLVAVVNAELRRRGLDTQPAAGCRAVQVTLARRDANLVVGVKDPYGRRSERTVADAAAAATIVESWALSDLNAGLLEGWTYPAPAPPDTDLKVSAPLPSGRAAFSFVVAGESSVGANGTFLVGAQAAGCVPWGPMCVGGLARFGFGVSDEKRLALDALGFVDLPIRSGRVTLLPGLGIGAGWSDISLTSGQDTMDSRGVGLRGEVHARLSIAIGRGAAIDVAIAGGVSIPGTEDAAQNATMDASTPWGQARCSVGLRLGAP